jgi:amidohydrolase
MLGVVRKLPENVSLQELKARVQKEVDGLSHRLENISLDMHSHPEIRFEETHSCDLLCKELRAHGFKVQRPAAGMDTAFVAVASSKKKRARPRVAFLCEYDALPEIGHACGHNLIATASLGAGLALSKVGYPGTVVVMGTPGEEGGGGKRKMIKAGLFKDIDAALMFHPSFKDEVGERMMAIQEVEVVFKGRAAHAAAKPEDGINALDAAISVFNSMNALRQHIKDDARLHGIITDGGERPNIVPERAECLFYLRAQEQGYLDELVKKFLNTVKAAELATGAKATISYPSAYRSRKVNPVFCEALKKNLEALGRKPIGPTGLKGNVSSDIGDVSQVVPAVHPFLSIGSGISYHTREFAQAARSKKGQQTMVVAAKALAMTALDLAYEKGLMEKIKKAQEQAKC